MPEYPVAFRCEGDELLAVIHGPEHAKGNVGVLIIVGGPQYRVGSQRQFVLLARHLAKHGSPVMRFDYRGMGDSGGIFAGFEHVETDIRAALDLFQKSVLGVDRFVLWGLCDGASAAAMYAAEDPRVCGLVLVNPWVRTQTGLAQSYLKGYYGKRLASPDFWRKVSSNPRSLIMSLRAFVRNVAVAWGGTSSKDATGGQSRHFLERMLDGMQIFRGQSLVLLSGDDLVATEFKLLLQADRAWAKAFGCPALEKKELPGANHTFSTRDWRSWVEKATSEFVDGFHP